MLRCLNQGQSVQLIKGSFWSQKKGGGRGERLYYAGNNAILKRWRRDALKNPSFTFVQQGQTIQREPAFSRDAGNKNNFLNGDYC